MRPLILAFAALVFLLPATARAQTIEIPGDLCGKLAVESAKPLAGKWLAVNRDGGGSVGPRGVLLKSRPKEDLKLIHGDAGVLVFTGKNDIGPQRMDMQPQSVPEDLPDTFNVQLPNGRIATVDVSKLLPCAWSKMPGYKGHVDYPLPGVGQMRMLVMLNFPSEIMGFGLLHFTGSMMGNEIDVWRYVTLTRPAPSKAKGRALPLCRKFICDPKDPLDCEAQYERARKQNEGICTYR